ncbi:MAG: hypothetical protein RLZZ80_1127 [Pseudomonadota bacterium]
MNASQPTPPPSTSTTKPTTSRRTLYLVIAVCLAPVVLSYVMYYGVRPEGRTNHGDLLSPQQTVTEVKTELLAKPEQESGLLDVIKAWPQDDPRHRFSQLGDFRGRWLMVWVGPASCDADCRDQLWQMRQVRLTTGRERDRVERLWLVTDGGQPTLRDEEQGLWVARLQPNQPGEWMPNHIHLVDPLGNLMMRFPLKADPQGMKKDLMKLLKASRVG